MAKGKKTGGRNFEPGNPGNPNGRPPNPPELKEAKKLTATLFHQCVNRLTSMTRDEIAVFVKSGKATTLELMIAGQIEAAMKGKTTPVSFLLDRTVGSVQQQFKVHVEGSLSTDIANMTEDQKKAYLERIRSRRQKP